MGERNIQAEGDTPVAITPNRSQGKAFDGQKIRDLADLSPLALSEMKPGKTLGELVDEAKKLHPEAAKVEPAHEPTIEMFSK